MAAMLEAGVGDERRGVGGWGREAAAALHWRKFFSEVNRHGSRNGSGGIEGRSGDDKDESTGGIGISVREWSAFGIFGSSVNIALCFKRVKMGDCGTDLRISSLLTISCAFPAILGTVTS